MKDFNKRIMRASNSVIICVTILVILISSTLLTLWIMLSMFSPVLGFSLIVIPCLARVTYWYFKDK